MITQKTKTEVTGKNIVDNLFWVTKPVPFWRLLGATNMDGTLPRKIILHKENPSYLSYYTHHAWYIYIYIHTVSRLNLLKKHNHDSLLAICMYLLMGLTIITSYPLSSCQVVAYVCSLENVFDAHVWLIQKCIMIWKWMIKKHVNM